MELLPLMYVAIGGAFGSVMRFIISSTIGKMNLTEFPLPVMIVNITGSLLLGLWIGYMTTLLPERAKDLHMLLAIGVLGGYTTFSTFSLESYQLIEKGLWLQAGAYMAGSVVLSIAALFAGLALMRLLTAQ